MIDTNTPNGYDVNKMAEIKYPTFNLALTDTVALNYIKQEAYKQGFESAIQHNKHNVFSIADMKTAIFLARECESDCGGVYFMSGTDDQIIETVLLTKNIS